MTKPENLKQMMLTSKMAFDYNYTMMMSAYEQNKLLMYTFLANAGDVPEETKNAIENWLQTYRRGCDDLKKMTDDAYRLIEDSVK